MNKFNRKFKYSPGYAQVDHDGESRANKVEIEIEMRNHDGYSSVFYARARVWTRLENDITQSGQILDEIKDLFPDDPVVKNIYSMWEKHYGKKINTEFLNNWFSDLTGSDPVPLTKYDRTTETGIDLLQKAGLSMTAEFVPWSRVPDERKGVFAKNKFLTWNITLYHASRKVISYHYSKGIAHCPAYENFKGDAYLKNKAIDQEIETGKIATATYSKTDAIPCKRAIPKPDFTEVMGSFLLECDAINHADIEQWAADYGFNPDSIKAKTAYDECLRKALTLRGFVGAEMFEDLMQAIY